MAFKEATDCCAGTAVIYGAPDIKKIAELLNGKAITGCCAVLPRDTIFTISDATDSTALFRFSATGITTATTRIITIPDKNITLGDRTESFIVAVSDETTILTTGTAKTTFRMPYAFTLTGVRASLTTAGTGAALVTVDINESGTTILSTKITIDATEKTSQTAATAPVISDTLLADDAEMTVDIDTIDTNNVATGLKIYLIGFQT